jgi:hypothetical protein
LRFRQNERGGLIDQLFINKRLIYKDISIEGDVQLDNALYHGTKRRADADNFHQLSPDALTEIVNRDEPDNRPLHSEALR